jgi:hypothetical protein
MLNVHHIMCYTQAAVTHTAVPNAVKELIVSMFALQLCLLLWSGGMQCCQVILFLPS